MAIQNNTYNKSSNLIILDNDIITPTDDNYAQGYFYRYFARQLNNIYAPIIELSEKDYNKHKSNYFYLFINFKWKLTGTLESIASINLNTITKMNDGMPGIKNLLIKRLQDFTI